jgi:lipopolysaccharide transport system permease protein
MVTHKDHLPPLLKEEPLIKIRPGIWAVSPALRETWARRELLYFLIWRDLKVRYRQTALGVAWVVLQPLLMALVFTIFISRLAHVPSDGMPYPLFAYAGLLMWTFFSNTISTCSYGLISNSYIIRKVYFPRLIILLAIICVRLVDLIVGASVLVLLLFWYGISVNWSLLLLPALVAELALLTLSVGLWGSVLTVKYRDVGTIMPVLIQLWMFASPIIYPASLVPESWHLLYALNPVVGIIEGIRAALFGLAFDWRSIVVSLAVTLLLLFYSVRSFCHAEDSLIESL